MHVSGIAGVGAVDLLMTTGVNVDLALSPVLVCACATDGSRKPMLY